MYTMEKFEVSLIKKIIVGVDFLSGDLEEDLRNWGFPLNWILSGSFGNSIIRYFNKCYVKTWNTWLKLKAVIYKETAVIYIRIWNGLLIFDIWMEFMFLSVGTWLQSGIVLCCFIMVIGWLCLMLMFYEIVCIQWENTKTSLWVLPALNNTRIGGPSWYYQISSLLSEATFLPPYLFLPSFFLCPAWAFLLPSHLSFCTHHLVSYMYFQHTHAWNSESRSKASDLW